MDTARTDVTQQRRQIGRQLALHIKVPLHHVAAMGVLLSVKRALGGWTDQQWSRSRVKRTRRKVNGGSVPCERKPPGYILKLVEKRQHIEDPEAPAHCRFAITEWVPGKSHAWIEVAKCRTRNQRGA